MTLISQIPEQERPRERMVAQGEDALSLSELLAICLGSGRKGISSLSLAQELLSVFGSLAALAAAPLTALMAIKGIGTAKAVQIKSLFALAKRMNRWAGEPKYPVATPNDVYQFVVSQLEVQTKEMMVVMLRDSRGRIFYDELLSLGTVSQVLVHPREVFQRAITHSAVSIIVAHNHPSGDPTPSPADIAATDLLVSSGKLLGIPLDDHLIVGRTGYTSLWEEGRVPTLGRSPYFL